MDFHALAEEYVMSYGITQNLPTLQRGIFLGNPENSQRALADWYDKAESKPNDPIVRKAYLQFALETAAQFAFLVRKNINFVAVDNPKVYVGYQDITADLEYSHTLLVYNKDHNHPILSADQNFMFRAVHDVFGHGYAQAGFSASGEYSAYLFQRTLYSEVAAIVLATETHAQSSWFNYGPYAHLPAKDRPYAPKKAVIVPPNFRVGKGARLVK